MAVKSDLEEHDAVDENQDDGDDADAECRPPHTPEPVGTSLLVGNSGDAEHCEEDE